MAVAELAGETDFDGWRKAARAFRLAGVEPAEARFTVAGAAQTASLFDTPLSVHPGEGRDPDSHTSGQGMDSNGRGLAVDAGVRDLDPGLRRGERREQAFTVPKAFVDVAQEVILHRSADRFDLMYRLLWRLRDEPDLMKVVSDIDVADAMERAKNVSRASHKMKAFVRFRMIEDEAGEAYVAWFEPAHRVLEKTSGFFVRRFTTMRWSILTPDGSCFWDGAALTFGPAATAADAPQDDEIEEFWKTYYASTFNPARLKVKTMQGEMPKQYWKNLPEASLIPGLVAASRERTETMVTAPHSEPNARLSRAIARQARDGAYDEGFVASSLEDLRHGVQACRRCELWRDATQGVCGEGPARAATLMIVGEQPGDQEDLAGRPVVGPAGQVLDEALAEAGIDRSGVYVTNAVKHFKHEARGKRRLHKTPAVSEVNACRWWLDQERRMVRPQVVLALGATASFALLNRKVAVTTERGTALPLPDGSIGMITVHPSYLLRLPDEEVRQRERAALVVDLKRVRARIVAQQNSVAD
ncbi:MAG: UdgX family uracil-DNA binding protein [Brevundimonas sp.]|uniref:UdgX family uracil-DNA binding protein n=1 Tax=Brevundimonas sp. TaxID=1871086 RepID=UPI0027371528|nr:UdgX family uracil-DNA binding protein [Brevundimonas sp.]MDP3403619.1 UdgX family uracil-DNA binding protein [Brevundimonas sp.]